MVNKGLVNWLLRSTPGANSHCLFRFLPSDSYLAQWIAKSREYFPAGG
jgi:hypothetical protein